MEFSPEFKEYIEQHYSEILKHIRAEIADHPKLKKLKNQYLDAFYNERPNKKEKFILYFSETGLNELEFDSIKTNLNKIVPQILHLNNIVELDSSFKVIQGIYRDFTDQNEVFAEMVKLS